MPLTCRFREERPAHASSVCRTLHQRRFARCARRRCRAGGFVPKRFRPYIARRLSRADSSGL